MRIGIFSLSVSIGHEHNIILNICDRCTCDRMDSTRRIKIGSSRYERDSLFVVFVENNKPINRWWVPWTLTCGFSIF